jgi:hypothetical protein
VQNFKEARSTIWFAKSVENTLRANFFCGLGLPFAGSGATSPQEPGSI